MATTTEKALASIHDLFVKSGKSALAADKTMVDIVIRVGAYLLDGTLPMPKNKKERVALQKEIYRQKPGASEEGAFDQQASKIGAAILVPQTWASNSNLLATFAEVVDANPGDKSAYVRLTKLCRDAVAKHGEDKVAPDTDALTALATAEAPKTERNAADRATSLRDSVARLGKDIADPDKAADLASAAVTQAGIDALEDAMLALDIAIKAGAFGKTSAEIEAEKGNVKVTTEDAASRMLARAAARREALRIAA